MPYRVIHCGTGNIGREAMRGLALTLTIQPRTTPVQRDPWPALRRELTRLLDR